MTKPNDAAREIRVPDESKAKAKLDEWRAKISRIQVSLPERTVLPSIGVHARMPVGELSESPLPNEARDRWMSEQRHSGKTNKEIKTILTKDHPEWDALETDQAVSQAIKRYRKRMQ